MQVFFNAHKPTNKKIKLNCSDLFITHVITKIELFVSLHIPVFSCSVEYTHGGQLLGLNLHQISVQPQPPATVKQIFRHVVQNMYQEL